MIDFGEKLRLIGELFGVRRRDSYENVYARLPAVQGEPAPRPAGFSDVEIKQAIGRVPLTGRGHLAVDPRRRRHPPLGPDRSGRDVQQRLLDRAFDEIDRLGIALKDQFDWIKENCPAALPPPLRGGGERIYIVFNGAVPTTAAQVKMAVGTSIHTILQVLSVTGTPITILEWGISFDASAAAVPVNCELFSNDVAITGATSVTPTPFSVDTTASACVGGTAATCFSDGTVTEGTVANARMYDCQLVPPTGSYFKQWPLGREPYMGAAKALRVRVTAPAAVNAIAYVVWSE